ncbi:MAG: cytochrome c oxidase subunit II [Synechococcales cyanobacterium CRU_2_2]|nr:cytochrome c oxidase subunit II [Synechococcales cyanobacterium CRU_2_2]
MNIPTTILTLIAGVAITLLSLWLGQNNHLLPIAATDNAASVDGLFNAMLAISVGLFCLVQGLIVIAAIKFRQRPGDETDGPPIHGNIPLEILWTAIPAVLVLGISVYSFEIYNQMGGLDPMNHSGHIKPAAQIAMQPESMTSGLLAASGPEASGDAAPQPNFAAGVGAKPGEMAPADMTVKVMGLQYAWLFTYPDTGAISGELHIPVGKDIELDISAQDVLHAFWVPQFRLKQDAIPGKTTQLRFVTSVPGTYPIVCAELCGSYHGAMRTQVIVHTPEDYELWQQSQLALLEGVGDPQAIALASVSAASKTDSEFLEPFAEAMSMDMTPEMIHQIHAS